MNNFETVQKRGREFAKHLAIEVKRRIRMSDYTAKQIAVITGHDQATLNRWLNDKVEIPARVLAEICEVLAIEPSSVVEDAYARMVAILGERDGQSVDQELKNFAEDEVQELLADHLDNGPSRLRVVENVSWSPVKLDPEDYDAAANDPGIDPDEEAQAMEEIP